MLEFWIDPESPYHKPIFAEDKRFMFFCGGGLRSALTSKQSSEWACVPSPTSRADSVRGANGPVEPRSVGAWRRSGQRGNRRPRRLLRRRRKLLRQYRRLCSRTQCARSTLPKDMSDVHAAAVMLKGQTTSSIVN
jgi:hypothetical protein